LFKNLLLIYFLLKPEIIGKFRFDHFEKRLGVLKYFLKRNSKTWEAFLKIAIYNFTFISNYLYIKKNQFHRAKPNRGNPGEQVDNEWEVRCKKKGRSSGLRPKHLL
jgi:hypothetical protein